MSEDIIDNTVAFSQFSGRKFLVFILFFLIAGVIVIDKFDSYFTDFWKIRNCNPEGYAKGDFMYGCGGIKVDRYSFGSIYLRAQKDALKNSENADVIIFGNSRTMRSFSTEAIDKYFKEKGLTYMVLASEGASFRSAVFSSEQIDFKPKIIMMNTEMLYSDKVAPAFRDLIDFPDKYRTRFQFFNAAQSFQKWACASDMAWLKSIYCEGKTKARWRSATTGRLKWDLVAEPEKNKPVVFDGNRISGKAEEYGYISRARELLELPNYKNSCPVLYLVNSPYSAPVLQDEISENLGVQAVFAPVPNLYTYDNSHLDRPNSERWGTAFVKELDSAIDNCLDGKFKLQPPKKPKAFDVDNADISGETDFETWTARLGLSVENAKVKAPDNSRTADKIIATQKGGRLQKAFPQTPLEAGMTMRFGGWFWSEEPTQIRLMVIRSCSADTPMETFNKRFTLTSEPQRLEVEYTFENDHKCGLVQIAALEADSEINAWRARVDFIPPFRE